MDQSRQISTGSFSVAELESLGTISSLYTQAKALILYSEEVDPDSRSNIQVIKELRDAFDHLMRVMAARLTGDVPDQANEYGISENTCSIYCEKNIDKAIGHVYRAAFDALDGTVLSLKEKIGAILDNYPPDVIQEVISNYWEIKIFINTLCESVTENRTEKDIAGDISETFKKYVDNVQELKNFYSQLIKSGVALDECNKTHKAKIRDENKRHRLNHFIPGFAYTVIGSLLTLLVVHFS
jgi:hypothetical protein